MTMVLDPNADAAQSGVVTNAEIRPEGITAGAVKTGAVVVAPAAKDTAAAVNVGAKTTNPKPWSALFKDNRDPSHGIKLRYVPPKGATLDFGDRILPSMVEMWGFCLVGHFTGKFPGLKAVHDLRAKWGVKCFVKSHNKGWVIFKFTNEEDRMKVLHDGPYMVFGKLLMLKELSEDFSFEDEEFLKVPIWVKFPKLPMKLWNDEAMSEVASMVGVPITTDKITKERMNNEYARVLIEVDVSKPPPLSFPIRLPSKKVFNQSVLYETFPNYCFHCKEFRHHPFICNKLSNCGEGGSRGKDKQVVAVEEIDEVGLTSIRAESALPASEATAMPALELAATPKFDAISEIQGPTVDVVTLDEPALTQAAAPANNDAATAITNGFEALGRFVSKESELKKDDVVIKCEIIDGKTFKFFVKPFKNVQASVTRVDRFLRLTADLDKRGLTFSDHCLEKLPGFTMKKGEVDFAAKFTNPFHVFFGC